MTDAAKELRDAIAGEVLPSALPLAEAAQAASFDGDYGEARRLEMELRASLGVFGPIKAGGVTYSVPDRPAYQVMLDPIAIVPEAE